MDKKRDYYTCSLQKDLLVTEREIKNNEMIYFNSILVRQRTFRPIYN